MESEKNTIQNEYDNLNAKYTKYSSVIDNIELGNYDAAIDAIEDLKPQPVRIELTKDNWLDYFEFKFKVARVQKNSDGSIKNIWLSPAYCLKDEYEKQYISIEDPFCGFTCEYCYMNVYIDSETGEFTFDEESKRACDSGKQIEGSITHVYDPEYNITTHNLEAGDFMVRQNNDLNMKPGTQDVIVPCNFQLVKCSGTLLLSQE